MISNYLDPTCNTIFPNGWQSDLDILNVTTDLEFPHTY